MTQRFFPFDVDTSDKFITGPVHDTSDKFMTGDKDTRDKLIACVVDTGDKFIAGVNDTGDKKVKINSVSLSLERHNMLKTKLYVCIPS